MFGLLKNIFFYQKELQDVIVFTVEMIIHSNKL